MKKLEIYFYLMCFLFMGSSVFAYNLTKLQQKTVRTVSDRGTRTGEIMEANDKGIPEANHKIQNHQGSQSIKKNIKKPKINNPDNEPAGQEDKDTEESEEEKKAEIINYVYSLAKKNNGIYRLNLADEKQFEFILDCIEDEKTGKSWSTKIEKQVETLRQKYLKDVNAEIAKIKTTLVNASLAINRADHFCLAFLAKEKSGKQKKSDYSMVMTATTTMSGKNSYLYTSVAAYDDKTMKRISPKGFAEYSEKPRFKGNGAIITPNRVTCNLKQKYEKAGKSPCVKMVAYQHIETLEGEIIPVAVIKRFLIGTPPPANPPMGDYSDEFIDIEKPRDKNKDGEIRVCMKDNSCNGLPNAKKVNSGKAQGALCDYLPLISSGAGDIIQIPFCGHFRSPLYGDHQFTKNDIDPDNTFIKIIGEKTGGSISLTADGFYTGHFYDKVQVKQHLDTTGVQNGWVFTWNIPQNENMFFFQNSNSDIGKTANQDTAKYFDWFIEIGIKDPLFPGECLTFAATSAVTETETLTTVLREDLTPLHLWRSCHIEDSLKSNLQKTISDYTRVLLK